MKITSIVLVAALAAAIAFTAEKYLSKPYFQWTEGDVKSILNRSPWVKQGEFSFDTGASASVYSKGRDYEKTKADEKALVRYVPYKLTWYTKIPRLAAIRSRQLQKLISSEEAARFAEAIPEEAWRFALESRSLGQMSIEEAEKTTRLVRGDNASLPVQRVTGDRQIMYFLFPLQGPDGKPFLTEQTKKFTFETKAMGNVMRHSFNVADCLVDGKLDR